MNACEQRFMATADAFGFAERDLQPVLEHMNAWLAGLAQALDAVRLGQAGLLPASALARLAQSIDANVKACEHHWTGQRAALEPAQSLARAFEDKAMLLVFGKFNAGKSSLCNFLAERFRQQGRGVRYFHLEAGQIVETEQRFHEGATETTARLQGVCLGDRLVLLDTPGLHSATGANAALTRSFLDSADAVLWLTSSTSPGQVQELDELAGELRRGKPLLPVVTRSDCIEEDEVDGAIVKCLCNKTDANRALQEADVLARAADKLQELDVDAGLLKAPVSVSAHVARMREQTCEAMAEAGFERLYGALLEIAGPALAYKQRKSAEMLLHYLQEQVLGSLQIGTAPALAQLRQALQAEREAMPQRQARIIQMAWRGVIPELPALLEQHAPQRDVRAVCAQVGTLVAGAFERQVSAYLDGYELLPVSPVDVELAVDIGYDSAPDSLLGTGGQNLPVGYENLHAALAHSVRKLVSDLAAKAVNACEETLCRLGAVAERMQDTVCWQEQRLRDIKQQLRNSTIA
ncbi:hypothetical protein GCM10010975_25710 [Comamonas phosphati]|nr:hypothetical protein GCM10010975_25710 [Comamonas phosphati]